MSAALSVAVGARNRDCLRIARIALRRARLFDASRLFRALQSRLPHPEPQPLADDISRQNIMEQSVRQNRTRIVILDLVALTLLAAACGIASGIVLAGITLLFAGQS
jgi:hypothetical protein